MGFPLRDLTELENKELIIKSTKIKNLVTEGQISKEYLQALDKEVRLIILKSLNRMRLNNRTRLLPQDI